MAFLKENRFPGGPVCELGGEGTAGLVSSSWFLFSEDVRFISPVCDPTRPCCHYPRLHVHLEPEPFGSPSKESFSMSNIISHHSDNEVLNEDLINQHKPI